MIQDNPPKIKHLRYLVRVNISSAERGYRRVKETSFRRLSDGRVVQRVREGNEFRIRYFHVIDSIDNGGIQDQRLLRGIFERYASQQTKRKKDTYITGSLQAFVGSLSLFHKGKQVRPLVDGFITPASRVWTERSVQIKRGTVMVSNAALDAIEELLNYRMMEYRSSSPFVPVHPYSQGITWKKAIQEKEREAPRSKKVKLTIRQLQSMFGQIRGYTKTGIPVFRSPKKSWFHISSGGYKIYHPHRKGVYRWKHGG